MASNVEGKFQYLIETKEQIKAAIQEKGQTISSSTPFREYADKIRAISGGSSDVCYVTFKNGSTTLYKKAVAIGDDCVDVLEKGILTITPTKASTAQYHYTYSGWSKTNGGAASDTALSNVTANRTVYAAFTSSVRSYTITYYDSDGTTVLKTETLAYGATPNYVPSKDGYNFEGWTTAIATVTGDASYVSKWSSALTFAGASWADIARISEAGEAPNYFKVGDTRQISLSNGDIITVAVAGFNHDTLADGSGTAGMSIVCMTVPSYTTCWSTSTSTSMGAHLYTSSATKARNDVNGGTVYAYMPEEVRNVIKPVLKKSDSTEGSGADKTPKETSETMWLLSLDELGFASVGTSSCSVLGTRYELFAEWSSASNYSGTQKNAPSVYVSNTGDRAPSYWTRHMQRVGVASPYFMQNRYSSGTTDQCTFKNGATYINSTARHLRFGFCV